MDYKSVLKNYILEMDATAGSILYQPCDGLIEVCRTEDVKQELLRLVEHSEVSLLKNTENSAYQELITWSRSSDILLETSDNVLFCLPKLAA